MKILKYDGPYAMHMEEALKPEISKGEVLVKIQATAICGSDVHGYSGKTGRRYKGMVMGHEIAGQIEQLDPDIKELRIGQKIAVQPIIYCNACETCRRGLTSVCLNKKMIGINTDEIGGFSEYIVVPERNIFSFKTDVLPVTGALAEPIAVGAGAARTASIKPGENVAIIGAGMIGLSILLMLKEQNVETIFIIDQNKRRLDRAAELGAVKIDFTQENPVDIINEKTQGIGADVVIEAVGLSSSVKTAQDVCKTGGRIIWVGNSQQMIEVNMQDIVVNVKSIQGIYCYNDDDFRSAVDFIDNHQETVSSFVEAETDLTGAAKLFEQLARNQRDCFRAVVQI